MLKVCLIAVLAVPGVLYAQANPPLDPEAFLEDARQGLKGTFLLWADSSQLDEYRWKYSDERNILDSKRKVLRKKTTLRMEVYSAKGGVYLRKTFEEGGKVLWDKVEEIIDGDCPQLPQEWYLGEKTVAQPMNEHLSAQLRDLVWAMTRFEYVGRESLNGRESLVFSFRTESKIRHLPRSAKWVSNAEGRAWFDQADRKLVRVEGRYYRTFDLYRGAVINKGSLWSWQLEKIDDQAWLPVYGEVLYRTRRSIFFLTRYEQGLGRYSDYERLPDRP